MLALYLITQYYDIAVHISQIKTEIKMSIITFVWILWIIQVEEQISIYFYTKLASNVKNNFIVLLAWNHLKIVNLRICG